MFFLHLISIIVLINKHYYYYIYIIMYTLIITNKSYSGDDIITH